MADSKKHVV